MSTLQAAKDAKRSLTADYRVGKLATNGGVYAGRFPIGEGLECDLFALPKTLGDYSFNELVEVTGGLEVDGRVCFRSDDPEHYEDDVKKYLQTFVRENSGDSRTFSKLFIPWTQPLKEVVSHMLSHRGESDFVLPGKGDPAPDQGRPLFSMATRSYGHKLWSCTTHWHGGPGTSGYVDSTNGEDRWDFRRG